MKVLAYRLQSDAFGDFDKSIRRILRSGKEDGVCAPFDRRADKGHLAQNKGGSLEERAAQTCRNRAGRAALTRARVGVLLELA
jgi:hypothetical protein